MVSQRHHPVETTTRMAADEPLLHTFDAFDTLIMRVVGQPSDTFLLLGRRLVKRGLVATCSPQAFCASRILAERRAHANGGVREAGVGLTEIWVELCHALGLGLERVEQLVAEELEVERLLVRPVTPMVESWARVGDTQRRVVLSDTYLTAKQLLTLLQSCSIDVAEHEILTSRDAGATKVTGRLFETAAAQQLVEPERILHIGDDRAADVRGAQRAEVRSRRFTLTQNTRYEDSLTRHATTTDGFTSMLAGASRMARIQLAQVPRPQVPIVEVASGVAAPILVGFATWLLQRAEAEGVKRLYFLARDGQVLLEVCRRLAPALGWSEGQLRYLHCSRASLTAAFLLDDPILGDWALTHLESASALEVCSRIGLPVEFIDDSLVKLQIRDPAAPLSREQRDSLIEMVRPRSGGGKPGRWIAGRRASALRYLDEQDFLDDLAVGTVDLGGRGSQFQALAAARSLSGVDAPTGFYAYLISAPQEPLHPDREHAWLFDDRRSIGTERFTGLVTMLESFCAADHGTVLAYEEADGGAVAPVLDDPTERARWAAGPMREAILRVAESSVLDDELIDIAADVRTAVLEGCREFWFHPTSEEVSAWSCFPIEEEGRVHPLARPASMREAAGFAAGRGWAGRWWEWPVGSIELASPPIRWCRLMEGQNGGSRTRMILTRRVRRIVNLVADLRRSTASPTHGGDIRRRREGRGRPSRRGLDRRGES